jgi:Pentapeptide repeats (8 copies)
MANEDHLELIKQGVDAWNRWRREHYTLPDLSDANLNGAKLRGADFSRADLSGADLSAADMTGVRLLRNKSRKREYKWVPNLWDFRLEYKSKSRNKTIRFDNYPEVQSHSQG